MVDITYTNGEFETNYPYSYDAFGNIISQDTPDPFGYCGEYRDNESGLIYLRARYYDSATGRFINEDPIKDGLNWYSYCVGNPVMFADPWGLTHISGEGDVIYTSPIPIYYDWNQDGSMDSSGDRAKFDANGNNIADWNEKDNPEKLNYSWYRNRHLNMLTNYNHAYQAEYGICWSAAMVMAINILTGNEIDCVDFAKSLYGKNFNSGMSIAGVLRTLLTSKSSLLGEYSADNVIYNEGQIVISETGESSTTNMSNRTNLSYEFIVSQIDMGIPLIFEFRTDSQHVNHIMICVGYSYDENTNTQLLLFDNSQNRPNSGVREIFGFDEVSGYKAITFKK